MKNIIITFFYILSMQTAFTQSDGFGLAAICNENVVCHPDWCNQWRSVALILELEDEGIFDPGATGSLINNERYDGKPFFLTALHPFVSGSSPNDEEIERIENLRFVFNYQGESCLPNTPLNEPSTNQFVTGATLTAYHSWTDFALFLLDERPPSEYAVFYNGWDNSDVNPEDGSLIHHPQTDIKKISFFEGKAKKLQVLPANQKYWEVTWSIGTSETGSSGAPFYNKTKLVCGQQSHIFGLEDDPCDETIKSRSGRFDLSWNKYSGIEHQLMHWLNPNGTENIYIGSISGYEPCRESYFFEDAEDLHTSENVNGMPGGVGLLPGSRSYNGVYSASSSIVTGQGVTILSNTSVEFQANSIVLGEGLIVQPESNFIAQHKPCSVPCENEENDNNLEERRAKIFNPNNNKEIESKIKPGVEYIVFPQVFPNPANNHFTINNNNVERTIVIYSSEGQIMFTSSLNQNEDLKISTNEFGKGVFFIQSSSNSGAIQTQKLIVY